MIQPFKHGERWLLALNVREVGNDGIRGTRGRTAGVMTFEKCWTGDGWASTANFGMTFDDPRQARDYVEQHREQMDDAAGR